MTIREILVKLVGKYIPYYGVYLTEDITQAEAVIKKAVLECLPEEREYSGCDCVSECGCYDKVDAYNQALTEVKERISKL